MVGLTVVIALALGIVSVFRGLGLARLLYAIALTLLIGLGWITITISQDRRK